jgi:hypothetical protein
MCETDGWRADIRMMWRACFSGASAPVSVRSEIVGPCGDILFEYSSLVLLDLERGDYSLAEAVPAHKLSGLKVLIQLPPCPARLISS